MKVDGEEASGYKAVKLDSLLDVPGQLVSGDDSTGEVTVKDKTGESKSFNFGPRTIWIIRKSSFHV